MIKLAYPLVCFDLDGTLVDDTIYIWKTLHEGFNTDPVERKWAFDSFFANKITYQEWFEHDLKLLSDAGATKESIIEMLQVLTPMNGAFETLNRLKERGHKVAIISGSISLVVDMLFPNFKFDYVLINQIYFNEKGEISGGKHTPYDVQKKADGLTHLCTLENITTDRAVFIGDNENDLWIAKKAGYSIAFNCKSKKLAKICNVEIKHKDLTKILPLIN